MYVQPVTTSRGGQAGRRFLVSIALPVVALVATAGAGWAGRLANGDEAAAMQPPVLMERPQATDVPVVASLRPPREIPPRAAIYLTAQFDLLGLRTPEGLVLATSEDIRKFLLAACGMAVVPFQAFGAKDESGWCRLSVGAVSVAAIEALLPRLRAALASLVPAGPGAPALEGGRR